jgi:hypothetical protein
MIYKLIDTGRIPAYRMGRVMRVRVADLDAFLAATKVEPGTLGHLHAGRPAPPWGEGEEEDGFDPEPDIDDGR